MGAPSQRADSPQKISLGERRKGWISSNTRLGGGNAAISAPPQNKSSRPLPSTHLIHTGLGVLEEEGGGGERRGGGRAMAGNGEGGE